MRLYLPTVDSLRQWILCGCGSKTIKRFLLRLTIRCGPRSTSRSLPPKVNYLLLNNPKIKIYGTAGPRIGHLGTTLDLVLTINGSNLILGDGGEGGATLNYQVGGILSYQIKPKWTVQGGWRYLTVHYGNNGNILNASIQGILLGATYKFK